MRPLVVPWLTDRVVSEIRPLWEEMLSPDDWREVETLLGSRVSPRLSRGRRTSRRDRGRGR
jgi:hypothetical protein